MYLLPVKVVLYSVTASIVRVVVIGPRQPPLMMVAESEDPETQEYDPSAALTATEYDPETMYSMHCMEYSAAADRVACT